MTRLHPDDVEAIAQRVAVLVQPPAPDEFLTPRQYAARFQVALSTVYAQAKLGELGAIRIGGTLRLPAQPPRAPGSVVAAEPTERTPTARSPRRRRRVELLPVGREA